MRCLLHAEKQVRRSQSRNWPFGSYPSRTQPNTAFAGLLPAAELQPGFRLCQPSRVWQEAECHERLRDGLKRGVEAEFFPGVGAGAGARNRGEKPQSCMGARVRTRIQGATPRGTNANLEGQA